MNGFLGGCAYGLPIGLTIAAFQTSSLATWLTAVICFSIALATTRIARDRWPA